MTQEKWYTLYGQTFSFSRLLDGFFKVKDNGGAPGVDKQTIEEFENDLISNIEKLKMELKMKTYKPLPVRRVYIEKSNGSLRPLGIPAVRDRVVQQVVKDILEPIFEESFLNCSYGFRPQRSAHMAVKQIESYLKDGYVWIVDADLKSYFDTIDHEILIDKVAEKISDSSMLELIRKFLKSGVMEKGIWEETDTGAPQGAVLSPLLANIYLNSFDLLMTESGHKVVRYADDWVILKKSRMSALRVMRHARRYLEGELKLTVHPDKTKVVDARTSGFNFLGFTFGIEKKVKKGEVNEVVFYEPSKKSVDKFKDKVREITRRNQTTKAEKVIAEIKKFLPGWGRYFGIGRVTILFKNLDGWIRRRIRMVQLRSWKTPKKLHSLLRSKGWVGYCPKLSMYKWRNSACYSVNYAMDTKWFKLKGWMGLTDVREKLLSEIG